MNNLTDIIEGIEKFAYEILIWILLIPKTLINIILNPGWVPGYVAQELNDKTDDRFDSYISPVILILICTLVPVTYLLSVPYPGAVISGPLEASVHQPVRFVVDANFVDQTNNYHYEWTADEQSMQTFYHGKLADYAIFTWDKPGNKTVHALADNTKGESHKSTFTINILDENQPLTASIDDGFAGARRGAGEDFLNSLQTPGGLFLTFIVLLMPMFFALAIDRLRSAPLSRRSFMHSFYIQCYYFSPITLAFWSLLLGFEYFIKPETESLLLWLPASTVLILLAWLFINETRLIMKEKNFNVILGVAFTAACYIAVGALLTIIVKFVLTPELFRKFLWIFYGVAIAGFVATASLRSLIKLIRKLIK